ncbi:MAG: DUF4097 domain-containing protein [Steroidobacteraceae bacterium]|jgi:DUF4097 and DUF4098 domain-containing protein YvlB|nr:DUF4097 domain-containing protein [Steroidobacteraceae bacterium]
MTAIRILAAPLLCAAALIAFDAHAATATVTRAWQFKAAPDARLQVDNLIGSVTLEPAADGAFHVTATITTEADSDAAAATLARAVDFRSEDAGAKSTFQALLPEDRFPIIHDERSPKPSFFGRTYVDYLGERRQISSDARKAVKVRVDLKVRVPGSARLSVNNRLGPIEAHGVNADLSLDTARGSIASRDGRGSLEADTGAGAVAVASHEGDVDADTGSGEISIVDCACRISADTGSGAVRVLRGRGSVEADTGSGNVEITDFAGSVNADTGSGAVALKGLSEVRRLEADTGSGGVTAEGDLSGLEHLDVDTGSGGVSITGSGWPDMRISMDVGSGSIEADVPGGVLTRDGRGSAKLVIGAGTHRGRISTGSGGITVRAPASAD